MSSISLGMTVIPRRNKKTKSFKSLGGKLGVLWEISANGEWNYFTTICSFLIP